MVHCIGFARVACRTGNVIAVLGGHFLEFGQRPTLFGELFALADDVLVEVAAVEPLANSFLEGDQGVDTIQRDTAVVADDAAAPVGVRQTGEDARLAAQPDFLRVNIEHCTGVVVLAVLGPDFRKPAGSALNP